MYFRTQVYFEEFCKKMCMSWSVQPHSSWRVQAVSVTVTPCLQCGLPCCTKGYDLVFWDLINAALCKAAQTASVLLMHEHTNCNPQLKFCICWHIGNITQGLQIVPHFAQNPMLVSTVSTILHAPQAKSDINNPAQLHCVNTGSSLKHCRTLGRLQH